MVSQEFTTQNARQTQGVAKDLARQLEGGEILALYGELGSGKTTFVQGLAQGLGIKKRILSPSFTLIRQYPIQNTLALPVGRPRTLYHIDLYRLENPQEAQGLGLEDLFTDKDAIVAIEWAEKIASVLPNKRWDIHFEYTSEDKRKIIITSPSRTVLEQGQSLLRSKEAIEILETGGIVVFPTDTAYGVGCRMDDKEAVERLLKLKRRPEGQAMPILVDSIEMAQRYLLPLNDEVVKLMGKYWPGGLTIVLPCKVDLVPEKVRGGGQTLGVRWPDYLLLKKIIHELGVPLLGSSANFHGEATPYKFSDLDPKFLKGVDFALKGDEIKRQQPSTVIDCSKTPWKVIRQGAMRIRIKN